MKGESIIRQFDKNGYYILDQFLKEDQVTMLRNDLDNILEKNKHLRGYWADNVNSDNRIYGLNRIDNKFIEIFNTEILNTFLTKYLGIKIDAVFSFVMGNRIISKEGNKGSGGGWHRDTFIKKQLKFILYLSDVKNSNGPFTYVQGSHKIRKKIIDFVKRPRRNMRRYQSYSSNQKIELTGKSGSLIIVDTSGVHRGKPIEEGSRYALTLYINDKDFSPSLKKRINDKK